MAQFHKPAKAVEKDKAVSPDATSVRSVIHYGPDWSDIIVIEGKDGSRKETPYRPDEHGPASSDAYHAWALPEHLREQG